MVPIGDWDYDLRDEYRVLQDLADAQYDSGKFHRFQKGRVEQCDGSGHVYHKRMKNRHERRQAKQNPECQPGYGRYRGYQL